MTKFIVDPNCETSAERMIMQLAGMCDGANQQDGMGFSKYDSEFGHWLGNLANQGVAWKHKHAMAALKLINKYRRQLGGIDYIENWLKTPVFNREPIGDAQASSASSKPNRNLSSLENLAVFSFGYDVNIINSIKTQCRGEYKGKKYWASFANDTKTWQVPVNEKSIASILKIARAFDFSIEQRFIDYEQKVIEKNQQFVEDKAMLKLNNKTHFTMTGNEILVVIDDVEILNKFKEIIG